MTDFAPPTGPPPPKVPEGWKAVWNDQYHEYFYVNIYTKQSQWDRPTEPIYPAGEGPPTGPPPSYIPPASGAMGGPVGTHATGTSEKSSFSSNNPYANVGSGPPTSSMTEDEKYARKLQEEEETRARSHGPGGGASNDYYSQTGQSQPGQYGGYPQQGSSPYPQSSTPMHDQPQERGKSKGLLGKLKDKVQGHGSSSSHGYSQQQPGYGHGPPMGGMGGGHYGGQPGYYQQPSRPMMGGPMMGGGMMGGGRRPGGGGMGAGGAMALGAGGGLLGGALLGSAMADGGDGGDTYVENNYGDDDMGGGDMGGDMGDMGGGDF